MPTENSPFRFVAAEANTAAADRAAATEPSTTRRTGVQVPDPTVPDGVVQITLPPSAFDQIIADKQASITHVFNALEVINTDLVEFFPRLGAPMPASIDGLLVNPDGQPAAGVSVTALAPVFSTEEITVDPSLAGLRWPSPSAVTDARGAFRLALPPVPAARSGLTLDVRGASSSDTLTIARVKLLEGRLGTLPLNVRVEPAPTSVVSQLRDIQADILATSATSVVDRPQDFAAPAPQLNLGEGDCGRYFRSNSGVIDRFRYSVLIRLVEPQMNRWQPIFRVRGENGFIPMNIPAANDTFWAAGGLDALDKLGFDGGLVVVNRQPVDRPLDITGFRRQIEENPTSVPKASTLGLGYIVGFHQTWIPAGLSLGDLLYSLPLAPGEQQRIAIEEKVATFSERDTETLSEDELQTFRETQDSSALATFQSAFDEAARGGSSMSSHSSTKSIGATASTGIVGAIFGGGGVSAGYSNSSSSGSTSTWQNLSRDFTSSAAQDMHSAVGRVAAASRRSSRTSVRMATASEHQQITTRVVTNHNHNHALTMQWWEVLRHFSVTSEVDDVQLVCFVPFELVGWLPIGQPFTLNGTPSRAQLLARYDQVLRYYDVLYPLLARSPELAYGMRALKHFAADPEAQPQASNLQQDVVNVRLSGSFLPFEEVFVTVVARSGARLGPVKLTFQAGTSEYAPPPDTFVSRDDLLGHLRERRLRTDDRATLTAAISLPDWISRGDVVRFDITRRFTNFSYKLKLPPLTLSNLGEYAAFVAAQNATFGADELERRLGGPVLMEADATIPPGTNLLSSGSFVTGQQMPGTLPMAAVRVGPVLSHADLLRIEAAFHHIVRNSTTYSKAVWASLTDEERAILLERYTIGVPKGGVTSADQEVPLLNCVANRVLGFFGNAAIMPFSIPPDVAASMKVSTRDIQDALLTFHRQAFQAPRTSITLPTRGTLGEAVLGSCNSSEKIDLTRFWNWQDSPGDTADPLVATTLFGPSTSPALPAGGGSGAGSGGTSASVPGSIISIANTPATSPSTDLLAKLVAGSPDLAKALDLTGLDTLQKQISADTTSAAAGRKEAIDSVTSIQTQAMKSAEGIVKSVADAAASIYGGGAKGGKDDGEGGGSGDNGNDNGGGGNG